MAVVTRFSGDENGESAAFEMSGDFELQCIGHTGGGQVELRKSMADDANYSTLASAVIFRGPGHAFVKNVGTNFYKLVLRGANQLANITVKTNQP